MISRNHPNRKPHNQLLYDMGDGFLRGASSKVQGVVYDLGCGEMPYRGWILKYANSYIGVDWSGTCHQLQADIVADLNEALPINDHQADTLISLSVMEHLREPQLFLNEAHRILKPGGHMILQVPFMWHVHEAPYDFYRYTRYGLQYMFEKSGFVDIDVQPVTGFWVMWTLKFNYQAKRLVRGPRIARFLANLFLRPVWAINQPVALFMDRFWKSEGETAGYFVIARKS